MKLKVLLVLSVLLFVAGMVFSGLANSAPYFQLLDPSHPQIAAGLLISPKTPKDTLAVTDLALVTHSAKSGQSIIPAALQSIIPPESWVPLQGSFGGSFIGDATVGLGTSANIAPIVAATAFKAVSFSSPAWLQATKSALAGLGSGQVRLGGALAGQLVKGGGFQSFRGALPGRGIGEIIGNAARVEVAYGWQF